MTLLVVLTLVPALYITASTHYRSQVDLARVAVRTQGELIRTALEHDMLSKERELIVRVVKEYSRSPHISRVMIFDRQGKLRYSSDESITGEVFDKSSSATCRGCHDKPASQRTSSTLLDLEAGRIIRNVIPLRNKPACHACHDPAHAINGVLIIDSDVAAAQRRLSSEIRNLAIGASLIAVVLLGGTRLIISRFFIRPLAQLETSTRVIAAGNLDHRVSVSGDNALARLGNGFNIMAESVSRLLAQIQRKQAELEKVMNSVDDGLLVIDETFTIIAINTSLARRLGSSQEQALHRRCCDLRSRPECYRDPQRPCCSVGRCFATGALQTDFLARKDPATGTERQEEIFSSPIFDDEGRVVEVVEVWRDITERKSREAQMAEFQRLASLGMLASGFSHEVNTPLGTMLICVDEARRSLSGQPEQGPDPALVEQLGLIRGEIQRCRQITQQFLSLSRGQSLKPDLVDLGQTVRSVVRLVSSRARREGVTLRVVEPETAVSALVNEGAVQQVLLNVLLNAIQASETGGVVEVELSDGPEPRVLVRDDGAGVSAELQSRIFEPFFTTRAGGTGLGLFVSVNMARQWGGDIRVTSEPGKGATFEVVLPSQEEERAAT